jgi:hypothetical protein
MDLLGWHSTSNCVGITGHKMHSLVGDAIHLAPLSALLASIFVHPAAPWWKNQGVQVDFGVDSDKGRKLTHVAGTEVAPKRRRTGGLKICRSMS